MLIFYTCPECGSILFHRNPTTDDDLFFHCQNCGIDIDPCEMTGKSSDDMTPEEINSAIAELTSAAMSDKSPTQLLTDNTLPQNITLTRDVLADKLGLNENQTLLDIEHEQLIDVINEYLSDQYEVCPTGFATDIHENEIELTDIRWDVNDT